MSQVEARYQIPKQLDSSRSWLRQSERRYFSPGMQLLGMLIGSGLIGVGVGLPAAGLAIAYMEAGLGDARFMLPASIAMTVSLVIAIWFLPLVMGHSILHARLARRGQRNLQLDSGGAPVLAVQVRTAPRLTPMSLRWLDDAEDVGGLALHPDFLHFRGDWLEFVLRREDVDGEPTFRADRVGLWVVGDCTRLTIRELENLEALEFSPVDAYSLMRFIAISAEARGTIRTWSAAGKSTDA